MQAKALRLPNRIPAKTIVVVPNIEEVQEMHSEPLNWTQEVSPMTHIMRTGESLDTLLANVERAEEIVEEEFEQEEQPSAIQVLKPVDAQVGARTELVIRGDARENGVYAPPEWPGMRVLIISIKSESAVVAIVRPLSTNMSRVNSIRLAPGTVMPEVKGMPQFSAAQNYPLPRDVSSYALHDRARRPRHGSKAVPVVMPRVLATENSLSTEDFLSRFPDQPGVLAAMASPSVPLTRRQKRLERRATRRSQHR